jgi:hypothetical protein
MKPLYEYAGSVHVHTPYSDGTAYHAEIAQAALRAGLDFIITTDHNVHVKDVEGYYYGSTSEQRVLVLVGEEVHDVRRQPQANHLLAYGVDSELSEFAANPQRLIDEIAASGGSSYLAHPVEKSAEAFDQDALPWVNWDVTGYTGIEIWNYMSEFKSTLADRTAAVRSALNPETVIIGPFPDALSLWDKMLKEGRRIKVIGGSDVHAETYSLGPLSRTLFPYDYLFRCINTHVFTPAPLNGDFRRDKEMILTALRNGISFVGYDLPAPTRGFQFFAQGHNTNAWMGEWLRLGHGVTFQIVVPTFADIRLIKDGEIVLEDSGLTHKTFFASKAGTYRVETYINFKGKRRGWIFSNPIVISP